MSGRLAILGSNKAEAPDSDALLNLYWNRAEIKKAYAEAKAEKLALSKQVHERDGSVARLEQKLAQVEDLLLDPDWVYSVAVHYQLRALNERCRRRVAAFAEQLKRQQETRRHKSLVDDWNSKRAARASKVAQEIKLVHQALHASDQRAADAEAAHRAVPFYLRLFKRRALGRELNRVAKAKTVLQQKENELKASLKELGQSAPPEQPGLDTTAKRSVNFMIMSFAQQLYIQFADDNLASLVKEAGDKSAGTIRYGDAKQCQRLIDDVRTRWDTLGNVAGVADTLQKRARLLSERAMFMRNEDTIPEPGSVAMVICINDGGAVSARNADLLGEDYWELTSAMSR